jgi:PEP-CTERM motif
MKAIRILVGLSAGCVLTLAFGPVQAATYSAGLDFQATDQSMWSQGDAGIIDLHKFIGPEWNPPTGKVGGIYAAEIPAQTIIPEACAWGVCTPPVVTPAVDFGDFGGEISGTTNGKIGFDLNVALDTGSVNVAYPGTATFDYPDPRDIIPGATSLAIQTMFTEGATSLSTNFPEASLSLDFIFDVYADLSFKACVVDCGTLNIPTIDVNKTIPLLDIDSNTDEVNFDLGFVNIGAQLPNLDTAVSGTDSAGNLQTSGIGDDPLIDLDIDLDLIATTLLGLPALTQEVSLYGASAGFTLLDVLIGAEVKVLQTFVFDPILMVTLDASDGQSVTGAVGSDLVFDKFKTPETTITPTFFLQNSFRNITSLRIDPTFDLELLSAYLGLDLPDIANDLGIGDVDINLGPVYETHQFVPGPDFAIFDQNWQIPFDSIVGASFIVRVPEPSTIALLAFGLALLGFGALGNRSRRRRRQGTQLAAL